MSWWTIAALSAGSYALKALGPLVLRERAAAPGLSRLAGLMTPALLAALVAVQTFGAERALVLDARAAGLVAAGVAVWRRLPFVVVVVLAAAVTAVVRAIE